MDFFKGFIYWCPGPETNPPQELADFTCCSTGNRLDCEGFKVESTLN
jgi:hypothetical protein